MSSPEGSEVSSAYMNGFKVVLVEGIGMFPVVGGLASAILGEIIANQENEEADKKAKLALQAMGQRVMTYSKGLVEQARLDSMKNGIEGFQAVLQKYKEEKPPTKGQTLNNLDDMLRRDAPSYTDYEKQPEQTYTYFIAFATLHLSVLRDLAYGWADVFAEPESTPADPKLSQPDNNADYNTKELFRYYDIYMQTLNHIKDRVLQWRINNISDHVEVNNWTKADVEDYALYNFDLEWHDTVTGSRQQQHYNYTRRYDESIDTDLENLKTIWNAIIQQYRQEVVDPARSGINSVIGFDGLLNFSTSYAWRIAQEFKPARYWKYICFPQGQLADPAPVLWTAVGLVKENGRVVLVWRLADITKSQSERRFPLQTYLQINEGPSLKWKYPVTGGTGEDWHVDTNVIQFNGTRFRVGGWGQEWDLSSRLVVLQNGQMRFIPKALNELSEWTWGL